MNRIARKYALIDRDGTIIYEPAATQQVDSIASLKLVDGAVVGLRMLVENGFRLLMVTNQDGLGTAQFPYSDFEPPQARLIEILRIEGVEFDAVLICPHFADGQCRCRKPATGLVDDFFAKSEFALDRTNSIMCGDRATDEQFARNLQIRFIPMETNSNLYDALNLGLKTTERQVI